MDYKKLVNPKNDMIIIYAMLVMVLFGFSFGVGIAAFLKVKYLENEIQLCTIAQEKFVESVFQDLKLLKKYLNNGPSFDYHVDDKDFDASFEYGFDVDSQEFKKILEDYDYTDGELKGGGSYVKVGPESQRSKRDLITTTLGGVPVNSEPYADVKKKNETDLFKIYSKFVPKNEAAATTNDERSSKTLTHYEQIDKTTSAPGPILARRSRVMHFEDKSKAFRRVIRKPQMKSADQVGRDHHRRHRRRRVETFGESYLNLRPAIQFNGDVSERAYGIHPNYDGNGRLHHHGGHFINWTVADWVQNLGMDQYFEYNDGYLKFLEPGLYFVYAQIYYHDEHDTNGFGVYKNNKVILQCATTSHTNHRINKTNTCYTAGVEYFSERDRLKVHDIEKKRYSIFDKEKSFFGAIKLGDARAQ